MRVVRHLEAGLKPFRSPVVALGNFDGVHLGHQAILAKTLELAGAMGGDAVVFTFRPHPVAVIAPERAPVLITSVAERLDLLRKAGVNGTVVQRFTRAFASVKPEEFVERYLLDALGASTVVVGYNVTFGHERRGNPELLIGLGNRHGFAVEIMPPVLVGEHKVSSSAIRRAIGAGDVTTARALLGRSHAVRGRVRRGDRRGAKLGFPTANILPRRGMSPPPGVYAVLVGIDDEAPSRPGVANLGNNPTFGDAYSRLETHLLDFDEDIYGRTIRVAFEKRLRGEEKFGSVEALVRQIRIDAGEARQVLATRT